MLTRRHALSAVAGVALVAPAASATIHPDATLLQLGDQFEAEWAKERELWAASHLHPSPDVIGNAIAEQAEGQSDRTGELVKRIVNMPARTLEGIRIKARAIAWTHSEEPVEMDTFGETTDCRLAASILMDLGRM